MQPFSVPVGLRTFRTNTGQRVFKFLVHIDSVEQCKNGSIEKFEALAKLGSLAGTRWTNGWQETLTISSSFSSPSSFFSPPAGAAATVNAPGLARFPFAFSEPETVVEQESRGNGLYARRDIESEDVPGSNIQIFRRQSYRT